MSARDLSNQLKIENPCAANWDQMIGNDWVRFCEHCHLTVNDLTPLTPKRVRRLIADSKGHLCVRYQRGPNGSLLLKPVAQQLHQIRRRVSRIATGAFTATLTFATGVSQLQAHNNGPQQLVIRNFGSALQAITFGYTVSGKVTDPAGSLISGATVFLEPNEKAYSYGTTTTQEGQYSFGGLEPGTYKLTVEAIGFAKQTVEGIVVGTNDTHEINSALEIAPIVTDVEVKANESGNDVTVSGAVMILPANSLVRAAHDDDLEAVQALVTRANVNLRDEVTKSSALEYAVFNGNREMVQLLLLVGADANSRDSSKQTVLTWLGEAGGADIVWDLINAGAKVNLKDEDGDTALSEAARRKNLPVLTALLHAGAKVDARNATGQTPLMLAADNGHAGNIRALVRAGADMNARDKEGKTALDYAVNGDHETVVKLLQSYGAIMGDKPNEN
jgi:hypothetical protein